jgi:hypothetical protein
VLLQVLHREGLRLDGAPLGEAEAAADPEARLLAVAVALGKTLNGVRVVLWQVEAEVTPGWSTVLNMAMTVFRLTS